MEKIVIIPTGDEIKQGIVLDTNSPALLEIMLAEFPRARVIREMPAADEAGVLRLVLREHADADLIVVIGGSGGGRRYAPDLAEDVTHAVLEEMLDGKAVRRIYGPNGHLWSCLVVGYLGETIVANVPGPFVEAVAAGQALIGAIAAGLKPAAVAELVAQAVLASYPGQKGAPVGANGSEHARYQD